MVVKVVLPTVCVFRKHGLEHHKCSLDIAAWESNQLPKQVK